MGPRWKYILKSVFSRRENRVIIPVVIIIFILLFYSIYAIFISPPSQPQLSIYSDTWSDLSSCRKTLKEQGFKVSSIISTPTILSKIDEEDYKNTVYLAIGIERAYTIDEADQLWNFMRQGGNVIIVDDFGKGNSFWVDTEEYGFDEIDIRFNDKRLFDANYIKNTKFVTVNATLNERNYNLILNEPSTLEVPRTELFSSRITTIAASSDDSWLDENGNGVRDPLELKGSYPVILHFSRTGYIGNAIIISDPGLFINDNWNFLDNSKFILDLIGGLIGPGGEVVFDESRHITQEPLENTRRIVYSSLVFLTSTIWSVIIIAILIISFTVIIGVKLKPQDIWQNRNLLDKKYYNILNYPYIGPFDFWQIYNTFLEKVRLGYGFSPNEFRELDETTLYNLIDDSYLWEFITQQFPAYVDSNYYHYIVNRVIEWSPRAPEIPNQSYSPTNEEYDDHDYAYENENNDYDYTYEDDEYYGGKSGVD